MTTRIGLRRRHRRHKASTKARRGLWLSAARWAHWKARERQQFAERATDCLMVGGPLDGERRDVDGERLTVAIAAEPFTVARFLSEVFAPPPDIKTITYVRTRMFTRRRGPFLWIMQPHGDPPVPTEPSDLPTKLLRRIEEILA